MPELPEKVKTFPIPDTHLHGAAVLACSLMDAQNLVDELERLRQAYAKQIGVLSLVLKGFADLFLEVTDHKANQQWLSRQILKTEREAARLRLPAWFWRLDAGAGLAEQLTHRAKFMQQEIKAQPDDVWDGLSDVLKYAGLEADPDVIEAAIEGATNANS